MYLYICKNSSWVIQYNDKCIYWIIHVHAMHTCTCTVEPPYKGHLGTRHFVIYNITEPIEVVLSLEVQNVLSRYEILQLGPLNLSFIWRLCWLCSIKRGSPVMLWYLTIVWTISVLLCLISATSSYIFNEVSFLSILCIMESNTIKVPVLPTPALQWTMTGGPSGGWVWRTLLANAIITVLSAGTPWSGQAKKW